MMRRPRQDRTTRLRNPNRRLKLFAGGGALLLALLVGSVVVGGRSTSDGAASPATLNRIAAKNAHAAAESGALMKARSEAAARQVDARLDAAEAGQSTGNEAGQAAAAR